MNFRAAHFSKQLKQFVSMRCFWNISFLTIVIEYLSLSIYLNNQIFWSKCDSLFARRTLFYFAALSLEKRRTSHAKAFENLYAMMNSALYRIFWSGRKFNQINVHFVPSLCKLWHKSYIANRTSFYSFSWCMKLTCASALRSDKKFETSRRRNFYRKSYIFSS